MSDRADLINSELGGVAIGSNDQCFRAVDLKRSFETHFPVQIKSHVSFFVTVDPCAGGQNSDFAIVSMLVCNGVYLMIGAETLSTKDPVKTFALLVKHVAEIRRTFVELSSSKALIILERNLGFESEHIYREVRGIPNSAFLKEGNSDRIGMLTTANLKLGMVTFFNVLLRENRVFFEDCRFVDCMRNKSRKSLREQLEFFAFTFSVPTSVLQKERYAISGKSAGGKDDLAMACLIGTYCSSDPRFMWI